MALVYEQAPGPAVWRLAADERGRWGQEGG